MTRTTTATAMIGMMGLFLLTACGETLDGRYANRAEAEKAGLIERGWLPEWLPATATEIEVKYKVDHGDHGFSFRVDPATMAKLIEKCPVAESPDKPTLAPDSFPKAVEKLNDVRNCDGVFVVNVGDKLLGWNVSP